MLNENQLKIEYIKLEDLKPYEKNCKVHTKAQIGHIANSIKLFGFNDPLGISGEENLIVDGHGRVEALRLLGIDSAPCIRLDHLSGEERKAYLIAHNSTNLETGFDNEALLQELKALQDSFDFSELGVSDSHINALYNIKDSYYEELVKKEIKNLVRNQFTCTGKYDMPVVKKQELDLSKIKLMSFNNTKYGDKENLEKTIHFFIYDFKFEYVYHNAETALEKLKQYYALFTPDYSLYTDMPVSLQIQNTFKNRWCGAFWQSKGLKVIPTISWSDERSFGFCFDGIEKESIVALSTYGNRKAKDEFMLGYREMLKKIQPSAIICYDKPFPEMEGNVISFPYNRKESREVS